MEKLIVNPLKGGDIIGFSFCIDNDYNTNSYSNFFEDKDTDYQF